MSSDPAGPAAYPQGALPIGTRLGHFEVRGVLGVGGFGIVYLAFDHQLEREVAVKEYMPASLAGRTATFHVSLLSQSNADTFALGKKSFINEGKMLARFDHPSLVKVYQFWEANSTAYMAMPVYRGRTVKAVRLEMDNPPDEAWLRALIEPLLGAIERMHAEDVYHRDIAPDNILIEPDGHPVLLDFGAARRVIGDKSQNLTAILKPSYAPIEQYGETPSVRQGPWTDIYALGATMHFLLLGRPPPPAPTRLVHDDGTLASHRLPGVSPALLQLIDWMLAPRPAERPQSVAAVRKALAGELVPPAPAQAPPPASADAWERTLPVASDFERTEVATTRPPRPPDKTILEPLHASGHTTIPGPLPSAAAATAVDIVTEPPPRVAPAAVAAPSAQTATRPWLVPAMLGAVVVVGAGLWFATRGPATPAAVVNSPAVAAPTAVAPAVIDRTAPTPVAAPQAQPAPAATAAVPTPAVESAVRPLAITAADSKASVPMVATGNATARPAAKPPVTPPAPLAARPAPRVADQAARPTDNATPPTTRPAEPAQVAVPAPPPGNTAVPEPARATADAEAAISPGERCRRKVGSVLKWVCMDYECSRAQYQGHPECVKLRADQEKTRAGNR